MTMTTLHLPTDSAPSPPAVSPPADTSPGLKKLSFPASRATRQAEKSLDRSDAYIYKTPSQGYKSLEAAFSATLAIPQYRRTYVQGCACATGIAGGGCCPGSAMGTAAQAGAGNGAAMTAMVPADLVVGALGAYGMYSGFTVARNAKGALLHLDGVKQVVDPALARAQLWNVQVGKHTKLVRAQEAASAGVQMLRAEQDDLQKSIQEQKFNIAVPGLIQLAAATTATVAAIGHLGQGCLGAIGGAAVGSCASALFALYGGAFAVKNFREYRLARNLRGFAEDAAISGDARIDAQYRTAVNQHLGSTRRNKLLTGLAWSGVCAAGILGTLVASGALAFSGSLPVVLAVGLVAGVWAMWQNSRTRYAPHIPISPHVDRADINSAKDRAITWSHLKVQDAAIKQAVAQMMAVQRSREVAKYNLQRLFRPQCGPKAFTVLAKSVQDKRSNGAIMASEQVQTYYESVQIKAASSWCDGERALLTARFKERSEALWARFYEIKGLTSPCCVPMTAIAEKDLQLGAPTEPVYTRAAHELKSEADGLEQAARRLLALDTLSATLQRLGDDVGALRTDSTSNWSDAQRDWAWARVSLLQLSGSLSDAVSVKFMQTHAKLFSRLSSPDALPINNVLLLSEEVANFVKQIAPELDGQFVHAFFNPRRVEAEMDFIVERELKEQNVTGTDKENAKSAAPQCDSGTCCR